MTAPKILFYDLEIALKVGYFYDQWKTNIPHTRIKHHSFIISAAWQWGHEDEVHSISVLDSKARFKKNHRDDYSVVKKLCSIMNEADGAVAHNGDRFDMKELNASIVRHGLTPVHSVTQIDTLKIARSKFKFSGGNSLANLCSFLEIPAEKAKIEEAEWIAACEGDRDAIEKIVKYNKNDIACLKQVYDKLNPFVPAKVNMNLFIRGPHGEELALCPRCGSANMILKKWHKLASGSMRKETQCKDCGGYSTFADSLVRAKQR